MRDVSFVGRGRARVPRARDASVRANGSVRTPRTMRVVRIEKRLWTHLWTRVVRLGVPRVGPAFPAVRCVEPGFAHRTLSREIHVSAPKRAAADVTRPRGPLPRTARLIGTSRRDRRGRLRRGGPHRRTTAQPDVPTVDTTEYLRSVNDTTPFRMGFFETTLRSFFACLCSTLLVFLLITHIMGMFGTSQFTDQKVTFFFCHWKFINRSFLSTSNSSADIFLLLNCKLQKAVKG